MVDERDGDERRENKKRSRGKNRRGKLNVRKKIEGKVKTETI